MLTVLMANKDKWFESHVKIRYRNGCEEEYVNKILVTPKCQIGFNETLVPVISEEWLRNISVPISFNTTYD
jgi:hypothetical protein